MRFKTLVMSVLCLCALADVSSAYPADTSSNISPEQESIPWALVAHSDLIVVGKLTGYGHNTALNNGKTQDAYAEIAVSKVLKGSYPNGLLRTAYGINDDLFPFLEHSQGRMVMAFLMGGFDPYLHGPAYQLYEPDGAQVLIPDSPVAEKSVQAELDRERYQIATIPALMADQAGETRQLVDDALDKLSSYFKFRRDQGVDELIKIGCKGVPYIVMDLNDNRPLHGMMHLFEGEGDAIWTSRAFERLGPVTVSDALPRILFQITGVAWQLRERHKQDDDLKKKQYDFWVIYLANHVYQSDPQDFGLWKDQCAGAIW